MLDRNDIYAQIRQPRIQSDDDEFKLEIKFGLKCISRSLKRDSQVFELVLRVCQFGV